MKLLHIVGRRNHGKTTLIRELLPVLKRRGLNVGTVKYSPHSHDLEPPGKDSRLHREAGAEPAAIVTPKLTAVFLPRSADAPSDTDPYARLRPLFAHCDLTLVEGHLEGPNVKVEVWRAALDTTPLAAERGDIHAIITDDAVDLDIRVWPRGDLEQLAQRLLALAQKDREDN